MIARVTGSAPGEPLNLHASCVADRGRAVLILGPSGAGKSALALQLMALGCDLVSDDRTLVAPRDGQLIATAPPTIAGRIEARGVGLLRAPFLPEATVALAVDLGVAEVERLPPERRVTLAGIGLPLVQRVESSHFPAAILHYLRNGRDA